MRAETNVARAEMVVSVEGLEGARVVMILSGGLGTGVGAGILGMGSGR